MKVNQYVLFIGSGAFHCMDVYSNDGISGYVIDGVNVRYVAYNPQTEYWQEITPVER